MDETLVSSIAKTRFRENPSASPMHPDRTVSAYAPVQSSTEALKLFRERIDQLIEPDVGDYLREVELYFDDFATQMQSLGVLDEKKAYSVAQFLMCAAPLSIEEIRDRTLEEAANMANSVSNEVPVGYE